MFDKAMKWLYTFVMLFATIAWAYYLLTVTLKSDNVVEAAGVGVLLGSLITWTGMTVNYYFRKKSPPDKPSTV